jgi:hypothetical protein
VLKLFTPSLFVVLLLVFAGPSSAITINFDDQGLTGPDNFAAAGPEQVLNIATGAGNVRFEQGVILENTLNLPANQTAIYGTASFGDPTLSNPLVITFANPIVNFFLDVYNGNTVDVTYRVADNAGNSSVFVLQPNLSGGQTTIGFAATGTIVTVEAISGLPFFDFFIDNVTFNQDLPPGIVPEPGTVVLLTGSLAALALVARKRKLIR